MLFHLNSIIVMYISLITGMLHKDIIFLCETESEKGEARRVEQ